MPIRTLTITPEQRDRILGRIEDHYMDFKRRETRPAKLTKCLCAFANADGGTLYVGIDEDKKSKVRSWRGFPYPEDCPLQGMEEFFPLGEFFSYIFLECRGETGLVLQVDV